MAQFDDPDLTAVGFLYAVMNAREVPLRHRKWAANKLMRILPPEPQAPEHISALVRLGVPPEEIAQCQAEQHQPARRLPQTVQDVKWLERCKKYGLDPASYFMGVQGHG